MDASRLAGIPVKEYPMTIRQVVSTSAVLLTLASPVMAQDARPSRAGARAAQPVVSAESENDEELKLLALRGVLQTDPDRAVPVIEKMLADGARARVRDRALFVLSQSQSSRARATMLNMVRNNGNPDLQRAAIHYLGMMGPADDREALAGVYSAATDSSVKRAILQSYFISGNVERAAEIAKGEKDGDLRRMAIQNLGMMNQPGARERANVALLSIYNADSSGEIRRVVVNALFIQPSASALVDLARIEKDPSLKKEIVSKLSLMKAPEATDYMLELLR
jgi:hypothetical protein